MLVPCNDGGCDGIAAAFISPHNASAASMAAVMLYAVHILFINTS